jgi:hypothetical protein
MNDHHAGYARIIVSGQMSGSHLSMEELIDRGLCEIQPQRREPSCTSDGDLYRVFKESKE